MSVQASRQGGHPAEVALTRGVRGVRLHARGWNLDGMRTPVLLVHGLIISSAYMVPTGRRLADWFPVYALDLPGFGLSEGGADASPESMADWLLAWMDAVDLPRVHLLGNSLGCQVAMEAAARAPERVHTTVLVGPGPDPQRQGAWEQAWRLLLDATREDPRLPFLHLRDDVRAGPARFKEATLAALRDAPEKRVHKVPVPTLLVRGERDPLVSAAWVEEMARRMPDARRLEIPGAAHAVNYSSPDLLVSSILPFLMRHETRGREEVV